MIEHQPSLPLSSGSGESVSEADTLLFNTTFVVFDLETTGMRPDGDHILEIGAVKTRGGVELARFNTLIDPGVDISGFITNLTGITNHDVVGKPQIGTVLPQFLKFAEGSVWVAHNARFDIGFIQANCKALGLPWPAPTVVDTLGLARKVLDRQTVGSFKLGTLARYAKARTTPTHRALDDAAATVDVLYFLIERLGGHNVETLDELTAYSPAVDPRVRAKRSLIDNVSHSPGVYVFKSANGDPLYIGTAVDLRRRLNQYFNGSDPRKRMSEMVMLTESIDTIECVHGFAAEVREARLLSSTRPPYNRQRKEPGRGWYLISNGKADSAKASRLPQGELSIGPFKTRNAALEARDTLGIGDGSFTRIATELRHGGADRIAALIRAVSDAADQSRYRRAAHLRDVTSELILLLDRQQRLASLAAIEEVHAAFPDGCGGWNLAIVRHGKLAASGHCPRGARVAHVIELLAASAETVTPTAAPFRGTTPDELSITWKWLTRDDVYIGPTSSPWASHIEGVGKYREWALRAREAKGA
ncbi:DEDD exonuclease domain-containing protein [Corynebacterium sp. H113]|uniref:DEDD exonuclease domain-containing protein n=1 Tax=Corynebacterium sp. H113 TaxID=3133419 RepID=UPI00309FDDB9